jgi:RNA polymerase sigma factor (sigma-70 family)
MELVVEPPCGPSPELALLDDEALVRRLVARDPRALEALYGRYSRPLFSLGLKLLNDHDLVEGVVQDVFVRLWTHAGEYEARKGKLLSWLLTITHHRAVDELRRRRTRLDTETLQEELIEDPDRDPSSPLARAEERAGVRRALAQLPEAQRLPITMAYYDGLTQVEISRALGVPLGTIKTRMRAGMHELRRLLSDDLDAPGSPRSAGKPPLAPGRPTCFDSRHHGTGTIVPAAPVSLRPETRQWSTAGASSTERQPSPAAWR